MAKNNSKKSPKKIKKEIDDGVYLDIAQFFKTVNKGIRVHGISKIIKVIREIEVQEANEHFKEILYFIFETVANEYNISINELLGKQLRGDISIGRKVAIVLAKESLYISNDILASEFNRTRQSIHTTMAEYRKYKRKVSYLAHEKEIKDFFKIYDTVKPRVDVFIQELNTSNS